MEFLTTNERIYLIKFSPTKTFQDQTINSDHKQIKRFFFEKKIKDKREMDHDIKWKLVHKKTVEIPHSIDTLHDLFGRVLNVNHDDYHTVKEMGLAHGIPGKERPYALLDWDKMDGNIHDQSTWHVIRFVENPIWKKGVHGGKELKHGLTFQEVLKYDKLNQEIIWTSSNFSARNIVDIMQYIKFTPEHDNNARTRCDITLCVNPVNVAARVLISSKLVRRKIIKTYDEYMDAEEITDALGQT